jgi:hypothetical protein
VTPRIAARHAACAALALLAAACAQPAPPPSPGTSTGHLTAPEPAPVPSVESWRRSPTGGPGVTHRDSVMPDAGAQGNASLDGTLPDLARPRLQRR